MTAALLLAAAFAAPDAGDEFTSENDATGVQPPAGERPGPFEPPTISKRDAAQLDPVDAKDLRGLGRRVGEVAALRGTCTAVYVPRNGSVAILNFDRNFRSAATVPIFKDHFEKWPGGAAAIEKAYKGKPLLVRGLVTEYRGVAQIKAAHPAQIQIVEK